VLALGAAFAPLAETEVSGEVGVKFGQLRGEALLGAEQVGLVKADAVADERAAEMPGLRA
jgi:hypothetical protein